MEWEKEQDASCVFSPSLRAEVEQAAAQAGETPQEYVLRAVQARIVKEAPDYLPDILSLLAKHIHHPRAEHFLDRAAALWMPGRELTIDLWRRRRVLWEEVNRTFALSRHEKSPSTYHAMRD